jgi:hypothetical protein
MEWQKVTQLYRSQDQKAFKSHYNYSMALKYGVDLKSMYKEQNFIKKLNNTFQDKQKNKLK